VPSHTRASALASGMPNLRRPLAPGPVAHAAVRGAAADTRRTSGCAAANPSLRARPSPAMAAALERRARGAVLATSSQHPVGRRVAMLAHPGACPRCDLPRAEPGLLRGAASRAHVAAQRALALGPRSPPGQPLREGDRTRGGAARGRERGAGRAGGRDGEDLLLLLVLAITLPLLAWWQHHEEMRTS